MTNDYITKRDIKKVEDKAVNVLIIGDNPRDVNALKKTLTKVDTTEFKVKSVNQLSAGLGQLKKGGIDVVLSDLSLPDSHGFSTFEKLYEKIPNLPIIVITDKVDQIHAVKAIRMGAHDYLVKGQTDSHLLTRSISHAIERSRTAEALRESEEFARNIINSSLDMIIAVDNDRRITQFNQAAQETFGYHPDEVIGKHVDILYAIPETGLEIHNTALEQDHIVQEILNRRKNGEVFPSLLSASPLCNSRGERVGVMGISRDITKSKEAETALREAKERAEASDRLKNIFLSTISHELRTPLNVILGYGDLLSTELSAGINDELKQMIDSIQESGKRLKSMIEDILDISLIETDQLELDLKMIYGDELIQKSIDEITVTASEKNLNVVKYFNAPNAQIKVDQHRLQQAIGNILQNAVKYTHEGTISISTEMTNSEYCITVIDTGIGIKDEFKPHIFTLFRQEDEGYGRGYEGAGLGLSISHRLVIAMGGRIEVKSKKGQGSTFTLILPAETKARTEVKKEELEPAKIDSLRPLAKEKAEKYRILIVEDNPPNMKYMEFLMKRLGLDYLSASSGEQALDLLKDKTVSCMLIDVSLAEGMSGIEFLNTIKRKKKFQKVPKIAVTAHAMKGQREEYLKEGFDDYMAKPFTFNDLKKVLNRHL